MVKKAEKQTEKAVIPFLFAAAIIAAAVLASIPSLNTRLVMFDTAVVDLTDRLDDPVEMLFGLRLGAARTSTGRWLMADVPLPGRAIPSSS